MAVLTISREVGSEGSYIGKKVAETLEYHYVNKKTIEEVFMWRSLVPLDKVYESVPNFWTRFDQVKNDMIKNLNSVIKAFAHHGNIVIVGRGSYALLGDFADVLNVAIQASLPIRVQRVMKREKITEPDKVEEFVKETDRVRAAFVEYYYNVPWYDVRHFDFIIDTSKMLSDLASTFLCECLNVLDERKVDDKLTVSSINVDPNLASIVSEILGRHQITH